MKNRKPIHGKVKAGAVGGLTGTALVGLAQLFGVELDPTLAAAIATILTFAAAWMRTAVE